MRPGQIGQEAQMTQITQTIAPQFGNAVGAAMAFATATTAAIIRLGATEADMALFDALSEIERATGSASSYVTAAQPGRAANVDAQITAISKALTALERAQVALRAFRRGPYEAAAVETSAALHAQEAALVEARYALAMSAE